MGVSSHNERAGRGVGEAPRLRTDSSAMAASEKPLRRRRVRAADAGPGPSPDPENDQCSCSCSCTDPLLEGTFWLTRIVLLRSLAFVYGESRPAAMRPLQT